MLWGHATVHHPTTYFGSRARLQAILMRRPAGFPQSALVVLAVLLVHGVAFCAANHSLAEQVPVGAADLLSLCDRCSPEMHPRCARPWLAFLLIAVGRRLHTLRWVFAHGMTRSDDWVIAGRRRTCFARVAHAVRMRPLRRRHAACGRAATKTGHTLSPRRA